MSVCVLHVYISYTCIYIYNVSICIHIFKLVSCLMSVSILWMPALFFVCFINDILQGLTHKRTSVSACLMSEWIIPSICEMETNSALHIQSFSCFRVATHKCLHLKSDTRNSHGIFCVLPQSPLVDTGTKKGKTREIAD